MANEDAIGELARQDDGFFDRQRSKRLLPGGRIRWHKRRNAGLCNSSSSNSNDHRDWCDG